MKQYPMQWIGEPITDNAYEEVILPDEIDEDIQDHPNPSSRNRIIKEKNYCKKKLFWNQRMSETEAEIPDWII